MGMSASQARLLSLTARLHDVELQAQNIMSQKIALATQKDALYQDYCDALDATSIKVAYRDGANNTKYIDANYASLCNYNKDRIKQYALKDNMTGMLIVSEDVKLNYECYGNDKYAFAYAMMGFDGSFGWAMGENDYYIMGNEVGIGTAQEGWQRDGFKYADDSTNSLYMTQAEAIVFEAHTSDKNKDDELLEKYNAIEEAEDYSAKTKALNDFREFLYKKYATEIYDKMNLDKQEDRYYAEPQSNKTWAEMSPEFNYYINLWSAINEAGGCQVVDPEYESGEEGNKWFNNMVEAGMVSILVWDDTGASKEWSETSVATSTNNNYLQDMQDDKELKKAEAEYEHELDILNRKDTKFDTDLSKLETERTSITTEMDSIKKVKDDNIERTFGIFS